MFKKIYTYKNDLRIEKPQRHDLIPLNAVGVCIIFQSGDDPNFEHVLEYIEQNMDKLATLWAAMAAEGIWVETQVILSIVDRPERVD